MKSDTLFIVLYLSVIELLRGLQDTMAINIILFMMSIAVFLHVFNSEKKYDRKIEEHLQKINEKYGDTHEFKR